MCVGDLVEQWPGRDDGWLFFIVVSKLDIIVKHNDNINSIRANCIYIYIQIYFPMLGKPSWCT